ncbi:MAG: hypothetical protein K0R98_855 [Rickettsiaceae bacterium]|jgi:hypothetical protein|nr:hypothetical protein [Rickettsiaceae bacterium]
MVNIFMKNLFIIWMLLYITSCISPENKIPNLKEAYSRGDGAIVIGYSPGSNFLGGDVKFELENINNGEKKDLKFPLGFRDITNGRRISSTTLPQYKVVDLKPGKYEIKSITFSNYKKQIHQSEKAFFTLKAGQTLFLGAFIPHNLINSYQTINILRPININTVDEKTKEIVLNQSKGFNIPEPRQYYESTVTTINVQGSENTVKIAIINDFEDAKEYLKIKYNVSDHIERDGFYTNYPQWNSHEEDKVQKESAKSIEQITKKYGRCSFLIPYTICHK